MTETNMNLRLKHTSVPKLLRPLYGVQLLGHARAPLTHRDRWIHGRKLLTTPRLPVARIQFRA